MKTRSKTVNLQWETISVISDLEFLGLIAKIVPNAKKTKSMVFPRGYEGSENGSQVDTKENCDSGRGNIPIFGK
jgi:hypothetical protein